MIISTFFAIPFETFADELTSGKCGENAYYEFDSETGLLIISGEGEMQDYTWETDSPFSCNSNIIKVVIENGITRIGNGSFNFCTSLLSIELPESLLSIGKNSFDSCYSISNLEIPNSVKNIEDCSFESCSGINSIIFGKNIEVIGKSSFENCRGLESIELPSGLTEIGERAFNDCPNLTNIKLPDKLTKIGVSAFVDTGYYCNADNWENDVLYIGNHLIRANSSVSGLYTVKDGTKVIADWAFYRCQELTDIEIPKSVSSVYGNSFYNCCNIESIKVENGNTVYDSRHNCNAIIKTSDNELVFGCKNTIIPNDINSIGNQAFKYCRGLTEVSVPDSVTSIGEFSFESCEYLQSVTLSKNVISIFYGAFIGCMNLKDVYYSGTQEQWNNINIGLYNGMLQNAVIHYNCFDNCKHLPLSPVKENKVEATYDKAGSYDEVVYCSVCGAEISRVRKSIDKLTPPTPAPAPAPSTPTPNVDKKTNTLTVKAKTATVKFAKLKKKHQSVAVKNVLTVSKAKGTVTYAKQSGNKKITINKKTGKVTVKKGLKKGTYKIKVKVSAAGNSTYKSGSKTVTFKIKVK